MNKEAPMPALELELHLVTDSPEDLEHFGLELQRDLEEYLDATVSTRTIDAPQGTKAGLAVDWNALFVALVAAGGVLPTLISVILGRLTRERKVRIRTKDGEEIEVSGLDPAREKVLIDTWVARQRAKLGRG